ISGSAVNVSTWTGWAYVAFVFDAYSRAIVGWTAANTKTTALVSKALNMAVWRRDHYGHPVEPGLIFHTDAGSNIPRCVSLNPLLCKDSRHQ
uniref:DDE-type integrase/transposase/recombinase n=1 Tax=Nocardia amamiensis TaxID=404578 RepID=UPI000AE1F3A0